MEKLKLSTRKSLYPEIEIEIEHPDKTAHTYTAARYTEKFRIAIDSLDKAVKKNVKGAAGKWANAMFGIPKEILAELPGEEHQEIYMYWMNRTLEIHNERVEKMMKTTETQIETVTETAKKAKDKVAEKEKEIKKVIGSGDKK